MDLVFAISAISPKADANFAKVKEIIQELIDMYGVQRVYYSIILFGRDPKVGIKFSQKLSEDSLKNTVNLLPRATDGSSLESALAKAKEVFHEGGRPDSKKVVVVLLDQKSESNIDDVKEAAGKLEDDGIKVIPVAFGDKADPDECEATTSNKGNVVKANDTSDPKDVAEEISQKVTDGEYMTTNLEISSNGSFRTSRLIVIINNYPAKSRGISRDT